MTKPGYVVRKKDGRYYQGCGYGGPNNPVPYFFESLKNAKVYKTPLGAAKAAKSFGGFPGAVDLNENDVPQRWQGYIVFVRGKVWKVTAAAPEEPEKQEGPEKTDGFGWKASYTDEDSRPVTTCCAKSSRKGAEVPDELPEEE